MDTERIFHKFPIRVAAFGGSAGNFSEETYTVEVNRAGARIALQHRVAPDDTLRIVNLGNLREADFRVIRQNRLAAEGPGDLDVECLEADRNLWDLQFALPLETHKKPAGALLKCGDCGAQSFCALRDWELEILASGPLQRFCPRCGGPTSWRHVGVNSPAAEAPSLETPANSPAPIVELPPEAWISKRAHKRLALKMPILVRDQKGRQELTKTEDVSKAGVAVCLGLKLEVGDIVEVSCPHTEDGHKLEQKAVVRNRKTFFAGESWIYGLRYVVGPS
jgi:hypothetical protein